MNKYNKKQKGTTLIELMLVIAIMAVALLAAFMQKTKDIQEQRAQHLGVQLFDYLTAVRHYVAANPSVPSATGISGANWLKSASLCGVSSTNWKSWGSTAYLPCEFTAGTSAAPLFGGVTLTTEIENVGGKITVTTTTTPVKIGDDLREDLAGIAAMAARAGTHAAVDGVFMSTFGEFKFDRTTGVITMIVNNSPDGDLWIRVDNPTFKNPINFVETLPASSREIRGVAKIQNKIGEALTLGRSGGNLIVDSSLNVQGAASMSSNLSIGGHISNVRNITSSGAISATGEVTGGSMKSNRYYDSTGSYYLAPSSTSRLNSINATSLSASSSVSAPTLTASSRMDAAGVRITSNKSRNGSCSAGDVAKTSQGVLMTCVSGKYVINASWAPGTVASGGACTPGSFAFDASNNLYVCR